jgi:hypothetical protein
MSMIDRVGTDEFLAESITAHIVPFCKKHKLGIDSVIEEYCKDTMDSSVGPFASFTRWEPRVLFLADALQSLNAKYDLILEVMRRTPVPWSSELAERIDYMQSNTEGQLYLEFLEQYKLMMLKAMTLRYGIKKFNASDTKLAQQLVPFILQHVDTLEAIPDAMKCVEAYHHYNISDVFIIRAQYLITSRMTERLARLVQTGGEVEISSSEKFNLDSDERKDFLDEILVWIDHKLTRALKLPNLQFSDFNYLLHSAIIVSSESQKGDRKKAYENCLNLGLELNLCITPDKLLDTDFTLKLIDTVLIQHSSTSPIAFK